LNFEPARIHMEIDKLAAYALGRGRITTIDVEALVKAARKNTVWQLADMLAVKQRARALEFLDNLLRDGEEPIRLVGALAFRYRKLVEARGLPRTTPGYQAARQLGMSPMDAEAAIRNAHRVPKADLLAGLVALADADSQLKSSNPNPRAFMEFLIARLTSPAASAA
jgi:DNA polymerase-3 subunit delta